MENYGAILNVVTTVNNLENENYYIGIAKDIFEKLGNMKRSKNNEVCTE